MTAPNPDTVEIVGSTLGARRSIRRFLPTPVPKDTLLAILDLAATAPSGVNTQPWKVHILTGNRLAAISAALLAEYEAPTFEHKGEYDYYPQQWVEPYQSRRRQTGLDLYSLLNIGKEDKARMKAQWGRNFRFFDAPVGLIFSLDRIMGQGSLIDYGGFLQTLMIAAQAYGLATCVQAAFCEYHPILHRELAIPDSEFIVCGMSLGYADPADPVNALVTGRIPAHEFTRFHE
ncbi:MAG: nitroreductase family protein [Proteobacteria bacterium]|nr:nitroreductase family protein [Pseudomonadota bacterium]